jgi:hypothetical protein
MCIDVNLNEFNKNPRCPKCGSETIHQYQEACNETHTYFDRLVVCGDCNFEWWEEVTLTITKIEPYEESSDD